MRLNELLTLRNLYFKYKVWLTLLEKNEDRLLPDLKASGIVDPVEDAERDRKSP